MKQHLAKALCVSLLAVSLAACSTSSSTNEGSLTQTPARASSNNWQANWQQRMEAFREQQAKAAERARERRAARQAQNQEQAGDAPNRRPLFAFFNNRGGLPGLRPRDALVAQYAAVIDEGFEVPAVPAQEIDRKYLRQRVTYATRERPGTIVVDVPNKFLYLVEPGGTAMRYGVGVGRQGFEWQGEAYVAWKRKWPTWTPPEEMIERQPELAKYSADNGGMEPGLDNPLGARALYLFQNGEDTLYRLHGTPQWQSIGTAASSGCIRLMNQDIIDLYDRVKGRAKVVVLQ